MRTQPANLLLLLAATIAATACGETTPTSATTEALVAVQAKGGAPKFWEVGASTYWHERTTPLPKPTGFSAARYYSYLSLAQYRAAEAAKVIQPDPPTSAAIGGASLVISKHFLPAQAAVLDGYLAEQKAADPWPGAKHEDFAAGEAIGRAVAAQVLAFAATDRVGGPLSADPGAPPVGPGYWQSAGTIARGSFQARPFFLASQDEFRPPPPPAFNSPAYLAALNEVVQIAANRTAEQTAIANYWNVNQSPTSLAALSEVAVELIRSYRVKDAKAAEIFFRMYAAQFDAAIACFNAKYDYWFIRPQQAATFPVVFQSPPHPSYPSAHSCVSGAITGVLAAEFPHEASRLEAIAIEASLSRLYAGIHYRFDMDAGLALGRNVARKAIAANLKTLSITP